jgi:hypothetical protein
MNTLSQAVLRTGLVDETMLNELRRFGAVVPEGEPAKPVEPTEASRIIEEALQRHDLVLSRETDFDVLQQYFATEHAGRLFVVSGGGEGTPTADFDVSYGRLRSGEYVFGWRSESIATLLCNGETYLLAEEKKVFFKDARELFFGDFKVFVVCMPSRVE